MLKISAFIIYFFSGVVIAASFDGPLDDPQCQDYLHAKGAVARIERSPFSIIDQTISIDQMERLVSFMRTIEKIQEEEIKPGWYSICNPTAALTVKENYFSITHKHSPKHILNTTWRTGLCIISLRDPISHIAGLVSIDEEFAPEMLASFFSAMLSYSYLILFERDLICLSEDSADKIDYISECSNTAPKEITIQPSTPSNWLAIIYSTSEESINEKFEQYLADSCGIGRVKRYVPRNPKVTTIFTVDSKSGQQYAY